MMPAPRVSQREQYRHDPTFRAIVDTLRALLVKSSLTPFEVREAAMLACGMEDELRPGAPILAAERDRALADFANACDVGRKLEAGRDAVADRTRCQIVERLEDWFMEQSEHEDEGGAQMMKAIRMVIDTIVNQ